MRVLLMTLLAPIILLLRGGSDGDTVSAAALTFSQGHSCEAKRTSAVVEVCIFNKVIILESNNDGASAAGNAEVKSKHLVLVAGRGQGCLLR